MKTLIAFILFVVLLNNSKAQTIKSFQFAPGNLMEAGSSKLLNSGYIVTGKYYAAGSYVNYATRYNNDGSVRWTRQESAGHISAIVDVAEDEKGNLFFLAEDVSGYSYYSLIKTDSLGNFAWSFDLDKTTYASYGSPRLLCDMSGYIYILSSTYEKTHVFKMKTNTGLLLWSRTFDIDMVTDKNPGFDMVLTGDRGIICTGKADADIFMVCISKDGNLVWTKRMNDFGNSYAHAKTITRLHDKNYLIAGFRGENVFPFLSGVFLLKIDSLGTILDYNFYYDSLNTASFVPESIYELPDHSIRVMGNGGPLTLVDFDASLNLVSYAYWGHNMNVQTTSNCFDMKNNSTLMACGDRVDQHYILRTESGLDFCQMIGVNSYLATALPVNNSVYTNSINFNTGPTVASSSNPLFSVTPFTHNIYCGSNEATLSTQEISQQDSFTAYPNPVQNTTILTLNFPMNDSYHYIIYNAAGALQMQDKCSGITALLSINGFSGGTYFLRVINESGTFNQSLKLIID